MKHFVKFNNWWWEYDATLPKSCTTLYNDGLGKTSDIDIEGMETAEAEDLSELNWYGTEVYDNKYITGWLSPSGKFFGCDYRRHNAQAKYVHGKYESDIENEGWVKISYKLYYNKNGTRSLEAIFYSQNNNVYPTKEQIKYIQKHYRGKDAEDMLGYLIRTKIIKQEKIKQDWGLEK